MKKQTVAILGASDKPERFAYKAFHMLREHGHIPLPVTPKLKDIEGIKAVPTLADLPSPPDTLTMYVGPDISRNLTDVILKAKPGRVIFNPGTENPELEKKLKENGIKVVEGCTLVMLRSNQF